MKQYHYVNPQGQKMPPVEMDDLRIVGVTPETLVWTTGMTTWQRAGELPELQHLFRDVPPPYGQQPAPGAFAGGEQTVPVGVSPQPQNPYAQQPQQPQFQQPQQGYAPQYGPGPQPRGPYNPMPMQKPHNWLWLGILSTILCCMPFGIVSIVYASKVDSQWSQGLYNEAVSSANKAQTWGWISVGCGFIAGIISIFSAFV